MNCSNCNNQVPENSKFCNVCGAPVNVQDNANNGYANQQYANPQYEQQYNQYQQSYGQAGYQQPYGQAGYQQPYNYNQQMPNPDDVPSVGLNILAFFIPLVGLILYLIWKDQYPKKAKSVGKTALIAVIINIVITILFWILWMSLLFMGVTATSFEYML